jgi:UDP-N-acetylglucosamine 2-epimerase
VQREAGWLGVPCLVLRDETEWLETLDDGHLLAGTSADRIVEAFEMLPPRRKAGIEGSDASCGRRILELVTAAAYQSCTSNAG